MKKGKKDISETENVELEFIFQKPVMEQITDNEQAFKVCDMVQDDLLTKVAKKMWEKELVHKFRLRYTTKSSTMYGAHLFPHKDDKRIDDGILTPKRSKTLQMKQEEILAKIRQKLEQRQKKGEDINESLKQEEEEELFNKIHGITTFPNEQINPITNYPQINYEENEAVSYRHAIIIVLFIQVPPSIDVFSKEKMEKHGQFLKGKIMLT